MLKIIVISMQDLTDEHVHHGGILDKYNYYY
jgi:hypothetical protein